MQAIINADLWDAHSDQLQYIDLPFSTYGQYDNFYGQVLTLKLHEDNTFVRKALSDPGKGRVLVVDGGGSKRCALVGDNLAQLAIDNGWAGIVVYGCIRDSKQINQMPIGIKALGCCPVKSIKRNVGLLGELLQLAGVAIQTGDYLYADADGILVSKHNLIS